MHVPEPSGSRFSTHSDSLEDLVTKSIPLATRQKADWAVKLFESWKTWLKLQPNSNLELDALDSDLKEMNETDLDKIIGMFVQQVRKRNGELYPGKTLYELVVSLQKHLEINQRHLSLIDRSDFPSIYYALDVSMKNSAKSGIGLTTKQAEPITSEQENELWEKGVLGLQNPQSLQNALFFMVGMHFALRGGKSHRELTIDNFSIKCDQQGNKFLLYVEGVSKTRQGGLKDIKVTEHTTRGNGKLREMPGVDFPKVREIMPTRRFSKRVVFEASG